MELEPIKRLLVELDSLLDTRLGALSTIDDQAARIALEGDWHERRCDDFKKLTKGRVENDQFWEVYDRRDKRTLALSRPTGIVFLLSDLARELEAQKLSTPFVERFRVDLNVYPYQFEPWEEEELKTLVQSYASMTTEVRIVSYSLDELEPETIKEQWDGVILYEFDRWFSKHTDALNGCFNPRGTMIVPALLVEEPEREEDLIIEGAEHLTPFNVLEFSLVERIALEMIHPKEFSIVKL